MKTRVSSLGLAVLILLCVLAGCDGGGSSDGNARPVLSSEKSITAFSFTSYAATGIIDDNGKTIAVTVPSGTDVTSLVATYVTTGASVKVHDQEQVNGQTPNDFTSAVAYVVTAADGSTATYTVTVAVELSSPTAIQLPRTGQTASFDVNSVRRDDGALQTGVAWPDTRFTAGTGDDADCMTDHLTGLMWPKNANLAAGTETWMQALDFVSTTTNSSTGMCGHTDWRLPNTKELRSLIHYGEGTSATWLGAQGFIGVVADSYWTSTTYVADPTYAWLVYLPHGYMPIGTKSGSPGYYVWPVRTAAVAGAVSLPATHQELCYAETGTTIACTGTGQDGEKRAGVAWTEPRFTAGTGDTALCVTDALTGLTWAKDPDSTLRTWQGGLDYIQGLSLCGFTDWRLPNMNELESLVHAGFSEGFCGPSYCTSNAEWLNTQSFSNVQAGRYWSSTTVASDTGRAWTVDLLDDYVYYYPKTNNHYVWPVRGGN